MLAICKPSMLYFTSIHHHCPHASYMYTQHALLYFYSSPLPSCQLYVYLACSTLLLFIITVLLLAICIPSMLYFTSIHHHCPHASYMYTWHALLYFYSSPLPSCQLYVYLACSTLLLFITTALTLAIRMPSMLYFTSIHHHCPHASYMYTQHALLYFYSSPLPSCQLNVYLACSTLLLFITTALMLAICIPSMLYFTSIHHHCPPASYMYTQHALLYFYSSPLPSCQLYVYLACSTLLLFITTALMLAICIPSMLYFTSIHHHCPHASYTYAQHALLYFYSSPLPSCQLYVYLACSTLLLFITTALMLAICIPSYMYTQHALLYFYSSSLPSCQLYVYLACSTLLLFITTALMLAICIPSILQFSSIHHHCPHASYMYTKHALLYFYPSPLPSCQLYVYLACSTLLLFITTALMLAICIPRMLYFTSIHHHCPHASYMYTWHGLLYFYSSSLPSCQLYVYLACFTLLLFITTTLMLAICIPSMLYFTSIHHHCTHASYMYTQHALLYFYSSPLPSCQLYVYLACSTLLLFITTALMLAICIPSMLYFTSIHHHCPHASYMYTQHALLYFYSSPLPSCYTYILYLACFTLLLFITTALMLAICIPSMLYFTSIHHHCPHASMLIYLFYFTSIHHHCPHASTQHATLLLFITTALMLAICIPSMLYFTSIHHHCPHASYMYTQHALLYFYSSSLPHASYMYTQHALLYFYSSPLPSCQLYVYLACSTLLLFITTALMLAICIPSITTALYFTSIHHHHCPHASYMYTQHALLYFYSSPLPSCQLYVYLACFTLLLFITTALMLAICIPSMLYFTSIHHHCPHASYMYTQHACFTLLLFITTALMLAICIPGMLYFTSIHHHCPHASYMYTQHALLYFYSSPLPSRQLYVPSMLYFTSIHHHCPHASYMYTQHALLYFYSSPLPSCQLYVYLACSTLLLFITTALMLAICIPSMLYFTSIHHHCPHASYMYTQHALLYFYSSPLPSCQLYVYLAYSSLVLFIITALMLAICIPSMLYFTSIHHHCPHASYMYTQHALLYFYSSPLPSCQLYVYLACFTLLLFIITALMLAICIPGMVYFTSIHHHCPHASYMYTQHALLYFYSSPLPSCQLYVYLVCSTLLLFIITALMLAICIPSMLYFTSIHHHCPFASYMYTQHALLYFYSSPLPSCQLYVYLACFTLLLFITTALMLAICIPSMLYFTSIHHHCPHASYMYTQHALLYFYSSPLPSCQLFVYLACSTLLLFIITAHMLAICIPSMLYFTSIHHHCPHASYMYTQHALLYFYSSPLPSCQLYVYLAYSTLLLFITTALMLAICIPSMLNFTSIHHHCPHASYMYTQHALLYFYSSPLPSCQLYVYLACFTLLLFIITALMLAICIPGMVYFTSIHHHCPHASYMYTQHALLYFYSSPLPSCQLYVYLACSTLLLFIITALMLTICIPSMLYFTSIHHHCPHASYMYTQHALLYFYSSSLPSCQLYVYLACSTLLLFITTALMLAICIHSMLYFTSIHHHCPHASYMYTQHALLYFYSSSLPSCQLYVYIACSTMSRLPQLPLLYVPNIYFNARPCHVYHQLPLLYVPNIYYNTRPCHVYHSYLCYMSLIYIIMLDHVTFTIATSAICP